MSASDLPRSAGPTVAEILAKLGTDPKTGLNSVQLQDRLGKYGPNALLEDEKSALRLLAYFADLYRGKASYSGGNKKQHLLTEDRFLWFAGIEVIKRRAINWPPRRVRIRRDLRTFPRRCDRRRLSCPGCVPRRQVVDLRRCLRA